MPDLFYGSLCDVCFSSKLASLLRPFPFFSLCLECKFVSLLVMREIFLVPASSVQFGGD